MMMGEQAMRDVHRETLRRTEKASKGSRAITLLTRSLMGRNRNSMMVGVAR